MRDLRESAALRDWRAERDEIPKRLVYAIGHYVRRRARGLPGCGRLTQPYQRLIDGDDELSAFFAAVADWRRVATLARGFYATNCAVPRWKEIGRALIAAVQLQQQREPSGARVEGAATAGVLLRRSNPFSSLPAVVSPNSVPRDVDLLRYPGRAAEVGVVPLKVVFPRPLDVFSWRIGPDT
jgi:hypothetical protein